MSTQTTNLQDQLRAALDAETIVDPESVAAYALDGFRPQMVVRPANETQVAAVVRVAAAAGACVLPRGGGSKLARYPAPSGPTVLLTTERLNRVVEYAPRDMTITVQSGMKLADLNEVLGKEGQRLPLDPPRAGSATIGGILATNDSGPVRLANGTARDLVIGMRMVLPDGTAVKSGGKVVKNVAGYDLHKLFIGSAGTLGLITEVTFKLRPVPEARRLSVLRAPDVVTTGAWVLDIMNGETRPTMLDLLNSAAVERCVDRDGHTGAALVVGYEETPEAVDWQCEWLRSRFGEAAAAYDNDASRSLYETIREWPAEPAAVGFKATMRPSHLPVFVEEASKLGWTLVARAGNGIVYGSSDEDHRAGQIDTLRSVAADGSGVLIVTRGAGRLSDHGWQDVPGAEILMRRIKDQFDPRRVFGDGPWLPNHA